MDKLTDAEIVKALEHCLRGSCGCDRCPAANNDNNTCRLERKDIFDLINRQKAEIERLEKILNKRCDVCPARIEHDSLCETETYKAREG